MEHQAGSDILLQAKELLANGSFGDSALQNKATVLSPLPVTDPGGGLHSWWVPLTIGDRLVAFFQFLKNGTMMRFSSFQRQPGNYESCPLATEWLDANSIKKTAATKIRQGETLHAPYLTYDQSPDRVVWAVRVTHTQEKDRVIYVAGSYAYV